MYFKKHIFISIAIVMCLFFSGKMIIAQKNVEKSKIYFSSEELAKGESPENVKYKTMFDATEDIYGKIFLEKSLSDYYESLGYDYEYGLKKYDFNYGIKIKLDGNIVLQYVDEIDSKKAFETKKIFDFVVSPNKEIKYSYSRITNDWIEVLKGMKPGKHKISIEMLPLNAENVGQSVPVIAKGSFELNVTEKQKEVAIQKKMVTLPKPTMEDKEIEEQIVEATQNFYPDKKPLRAIIVDKEGEWELTKDIHGNVISRSIVAAVLLVGNKGRCYVKSAVYQQRHQGNGKFDEVIYSRIAYGYYDYTITCDKVPDDQNINYK